MGNPPKFTRRDFLRTGADLVGAVDALCQAAR